MPIEKSHFCLPSIHFKVGIWKLLKGEARVYLIYLVREHTDFLEDGVDRPTPLSASGEGNNAVTAHVVTASHDGPASTQSHQTPHKDAVDGDFPPLKTMLG